MIRISAESVLSSSKRLKAIAGSRRGVCSNVDKCFHPGNPPLVSEQVTATRADKQETEKEWV